MFACLSLSKSCASRANICRALSFISTFASSGTTDSFKVTSCLDFSWARYTAESPPRARWRKIVRLPLRMIRPISRGINAAALKRLDNSCSQSSVYEMPLSARASAAADPFLEPLSAELSKRRRFLTSSLSSSTVGSISASGAKTSAETSNCSRSRKLSRVRSIDIRDEEAAVSRFFLLRVCRAKVFDRLYRHRCA